MESKRWFLTVSNYYEDTRTETFALREPIEPRWQPEPPARIAYKFLRKWFPQLIFQSHYEPPLDSNRWTIRIIFFGSRVMVLPPA